MKKFLVGFALPAAAAIAVVGSGFAVWYFGEGLNRDNGEASVNVTQAVAAGHFSFNSKATLNLDQTQTNRDAIAKSTPFADYNNGEYTGKDFEATGVSLIDFMAPYGVNYAKIGEGSDIVKYDGVTNTETVDHVDGKVKTTKTTYVFIPKAVAAYVEVASGTPYTIDTAGYKLNSSTTLAAADYTAYSYTWDDSEDAIELKAKFTFQYIDDKEPSTLAAYKTMKAAVNGSKVVISHEAKLVKVA